MKRPTSQPKSRHKGPAPLKIAGSEFTGLLSLAVAAATLALGIISVSSIISSQLGLPEKVTFWIGLLMFLAVLVGVGFALLRYTLTNKQVIVLVVAGAVLSGAMFLAFYQRASRNLSYYEDARERLFQPESDQEDYKWAIGLFKQELQRSPGNVPARAWLSICQGLLYIFYQSTDDKLKGDACQDADEAYRLDATSAEAHLARARCAVLKNDDIKVDNELDRALERNPSDAMIWLAAAVTRQWRGQNEKATANYEKAEELAPNDARISLNYGHHLYEMGEQEQVHSRALLEKAIRRKPHSAYFAVVRAVAEISWTGDVQAARKILDRLPKNVNPDCRVTSARCTLALYERDFEAALRFVRECPAEKVFSVDAGGLGFPDTKREAEGTILLFKRDPEAKNYLEPLWHVYADALKGSSKPEHNAALAVFDAWTGRKEDAIKHAEEAIRNLPAKGPRRKGVILGVAKAYAWAGELERAWGQIDSFWSEFGGKTGMSRHNFRLDPSWAPMRDYPEFRKFVGE